jgi:hypothetical protein
MNTEGIGGDGGDGGGGRQPTPERRQGSPFAKELDERLAGDEPLVNVVTWWPRAYWPWAEAQPPVHEGGPSTNELSDNEEHVYALNGLWRDASTDEQIALTEEHPDPDVQLAWRELRQAREDLRRRRAQV